MTPINSVLTIPRAYAQEPSGPAVELSPESKSEAIWESAKDLAKAEFPHLLAMNFVPFWSTGRYLVGDLKNEELPWHVLAMDIAFAVPVLRGGMVLGKVGGSLLLRGIGVKGAITLGGAGKLGQRLVATNQMLGSVESVVAPVRDFVVPIYFGAHGIYQLGNAAVSGNLASADGVVGGIELGLAILSGRSHFYRTHNVEKRFFEAASHDFVRGGKAAAVHPQHLRHYMNEAMGPMGKPIPPPQDVPEKHLIEALNRYDFTTSQEAVATYGQFFSGLATVARWGRLFLSQKDRMGLGEKQVEFLLRGWSREFFYTQKARVVVEGFEENLAPLLRASEEALAKGESVTPVIVASTHKTCWPDFASGWNRTGRVSIEGDKYNFQDFWLVKLTGFAKLMRDLGKVIFVDRGQRGLLAKLWQKITGENGLTREERLRLYNASLANAMDRGKIPLKFVTDGRHPVAYGNNKGEFLEAGIFGQIPYPERPADFLKKGGVSCVSIVATAKLRRDVYVVPVHLEMGAIAPKNWAINGLLRKVAGIPPWVQPHFSQQQITIRYGKPIKVTPEMATGIGDQSSLEEISIAAEPMYQKLEEAMIELSGIIPLRRQWVLENIIPTKVHREYRIGAALNLDHVPREGWMVVDRVLTRKPGNPIREEAFKKLSNILEGPADEVAGACKELFKEVTERLVRGYRG